MMRSLATLSILLSLAPSLASQEVGFLRAEQYELQANQDLVLFLGRDQDGKWKTPQWPEEHRWFFVRASGGQSNAPKVQAVRPAHQARQEHSSAPAERVRMRMIEADVTLIGMDRPARIETLPARGLESFLNARVQSDLLGDAWRQSLQGQEVRVRRIESAKLLVRVLGEGGWLPNSATAQSKTGQSVEIRPLADPTSVRVRGDLPVKVYLPFGSKEGVKVRARHLQSGREQTFLTDAGGTGFFTVTASGRWTVEVHGARPLPDDPEADWELATATLCFEVPHWDPREGGK